MGIKTMNTQKGKVPANQIYNILIKAQEIRLEKHNTDREKYEETKYQGYIKNYKCVRQKNEPKFRKYNLCNLHPSTLSIKSS